MIVRPAKVRALLQEKSAAAQVSEGAVVAAVQVLEAEAAQLAEAVADVFRQRNESRAVQRLEIRRRIDDSDVEAAARRSHGNP